MGEFLMVHPAPPLIVAQTQKLDALKTHKKGLMQQLFPAPEEVEA
jgi:type I restriction enzyme S subunit